MADFPNPYQDPTAAATDPSFGLLASGGPGSVAPNPNVPPEVKQQYFQGWQTALQDPAIRAGLLQFGIQAMQPHPVQQTDQGAFANALGAGAEAASTNVTQAEEDRRKQQLVDIQAGQLAESTREHDLANQLGYANIDARQHNANITAQNRLEVARIAAANHLDVAETNRLAVEADNWNIFHPGEPFDAQTALANMRAGMGVPRANVNNPAAAQTGAQTGATPPTTGAAAPGQGASTAIPQVPAPLAGKPGLTWSPSTRRFYDSNGASYNEQGVPQP